MLAVTTELPAFCTVVGGGCHDVNFLDDIPVAAGNYYVLDRGYLDFRRLHRIAQTGAWFVIRAKRKIRFYVCESRPVDKSTGLRCDQTIRLNSNQARRDYPEKLRRIRFFDAENDLSLVFLTNNFALPALIIAAIYRRRWEIELFFRWINSTSACADSFHKPQRRRCPDLDGDLFLPVGRDRQTRTGAPGQSSSGSANCVDLGA